MAWRSQLHQSWQVTGDKLRPGNLSFPSFSFFFFFGFLGSYPWHMEVSRLGVESELQLPAYTTPTANAGSLTHWAKPGIKLESWWILVGFVTHWAMMGTPSSPFPKRKGLLWPARGPRINTDLPSLLEDYTILKSHQYRCSFSRIQFENYVTSQRMVYTTEKCPKKDMREGNFYRMNKNLSIF